MEPHVLAVDLGGTYTKIGRVAASGRLLEVTQVPTVKDAQGRASVDFLQQVFGERITAETRHCALVFPGVTAAGVAITAANVGWRDLDVQGRLAPQLPLPLAVGHDVRAGGLAEWRLGSGKGCSDFVFVPLGTGVAAAVMVDSRPLIGGGWVGELGHVRVNAAGERACSCGQSGCLETISSAAGVRRSYASWRKIALAAAPTTQELAELAAAEPAAREAFALAAVGLAEAVRLLATLLGPSRISFGGGLSGSYELLRPTLEATVADLPFQRQPELVTAQLGPHAGLIGAALIGWDEQAGRATQ